MSYIKLEDAILEIQKFGVGAQDFEDYTPEQAERFVIGRLRSIPAADVTPVVHGRWVYNDGDNIPYCSECMMPQDTECNYCPSCGAKMDEEDEVKNE